MNKPVDKGGGLIFYDEWGEFKMTKQQEKMLKDIMKGTKMSVIRFGRTKPMPNYFYNLIKDATKKEITK